jgi:uncharacterized protein (TIGR02466 family)
MITKNINLFSCPIFYEDTELDNKKLIKYCQSVKNKEGRIVSNQGGYQSNFLDMSTEELQPLILQIIKNLKSYINICAFKNDLKYTIEVMWLNINSYKDSNIPHIHPDCLFSGVYYVKVPKDSGSLVFIHPQSELISYDWKDKFKSKFIENNSENWKMPIKDSVLCFFPSWLRHSVMPNLNKKEDRISISFNISLAKNYGY